MTQLEKSRLIVSQSGSDSTYSTSALFVSLQVGTPQDYTILMFVNVHDFFMRTVCMHHHQTHACHALCGRNDEFGRESCHRPRGDARDQRSRRTRIHMTTHAVRTLVRPGLGCYLTLYVRYTGTHKVTCVFFNPVAVEQKRESRQLTPG